MMGVVDQMRTHGHTVESINLVLQEQGVKIAARTYRTWRQDCASTRAVTDALVLDAFRDAAWVTVRHPDGSEYRRMIPEGLYGRKRMTALIRRSRLTGASRGAVDRAMRTLGLVGITRAKAIRTTISAKDGIRAGDLLNKDFTGPRPDHTWSQISRLCGHGRAGCMSHSSFDLFSQRIVAWHAETTKYVELVMIPLRMALLDGDGQGHGSDQVSCGIIHRRVPITRPWC